MFVALCSYALFEEVKPEHILNYSLSAVSAAFCFGVSLMFCFYTFKMLEITRKNKKANRKLITIETTVSQMN